jgi:hypothetical protein
VDGQCHALATSSLGKRLVPIVQEAGWASRPVWMGLENLTPAGLEPWTVPACSKLPYLLCHPSCPAQLYLDCNYSHLLHVSTVTPVYLLGEDVGGFVFPVLRRNVVVLKQWETLTEQRSVTFQRTWILTVIEL